MTTGQTRCIAQGALDSGVARSARPKRGRRLTDSLTSAFLGCLVLIAIGPVSALAQEAALRFDGGDFVVFGTVPALSDHTIEAWIKPVSNPAGQIIVAQNAGPSASCGFGTGLIISSNLPAYLVDPAGCGNGDSILGPNSVAGEWTHVAGTFDASTKTGRFYVNGQLVGTKSPMPFTSSTFLAAGAVFFFNGTQSHYTGDLAEIRIWSETRTAKQIKASMSCSLTGAEPGLNGYWKVNEGTGQTVQDSSPGGRNGVLGSNGNVETSDPTWVFPGPPITGTCGPPVGGSTSGMIPSTGTVTCRNVTTGDIVTITIQEGQKSWNCEKAGLIVNSGDIIRQVISVKGPAS